MSLFDRVVQAIIGRGLFERSERRRLERQYKDVAESLKLVTDVSPEPRLEVHSGSTSVYSDPKSVSTQRRQRARDELLPPPRPRIQRPQSAFPDATARQVTSPSGPPDITAVDLTEEQLKRTYSSDNVWDLQQHQLPPLPTMKGIGRYRMYARADPEWQMNHLHRSLDDINGPLLDQLGDFKIAEIEPEIWQHYRAHDPRSASFPNSPTSDSASAREVAVEHIDARTGTRISRGFTPSTASSVASSFRDGSNGHHRKDSCVSMSSTSSDPDLKHVKNSGHLSSIRPTAVSPTSSASPLAAIKETQETSTTPPMGSGPCEFDGTGNTDMESNISEDEEFAWVDVLEAGVDKDMTGNLSKKVERNKRKSTAHRRPWTRARKACEDRPRSKHASNLVLDRSRTARRSTKPSPRSSQSQRKILINTQRGVADETTDSVARNAPAPQMLSERASPAGLGDVVQAEDGLDRFKVESEKIGDNQSPEADIRSERDSGSGEEKDVEKEDDTASLRSNAVVRTLVTELALQA